MTDLVRLPILAVTLALGASCSTKPAPPPTQPEQARKDAKDGKDAEPPSADQPNRALHADTIPFFTTETVANSITPPPVQVPVVANVVGVYGVRTADRITFLSQSAMEEEGMTLEQVHEVAMTNLRGMERQLAAGIKRRRMDIKTGGSVFVMDGNLASTQLIFIDQWSASAADFEGDLLASFVGMHTIIYVDAGDAASLEAFKAVRAELHRDEPDETSDILQLGTQQWVAWEG